MNGSSLSQKKERRVLSFALLLVGAIFLCNPNVNLFDVLPDAIGYALLASAVRLSAEVFPHFDAAHRGFRILFWINVAKIPAILAMMRIAGINMDERGIIAVFALGFAVVEWIFAIPAFRALFEGFTYIGEREGVESALSVKESGRSSDGVALFTLIFLIVKGALSFLPELALLSSFFYSNSLENKTINPAAFYPILALFGFLVMLVLGLAWLFTLRPYLVGMRDDKRMAELLSAKAAVLAPALDATEDKRKKKLFFAFILAGFFFAIDPLIENRDLLPNALSALAFFFAFSFVGGKDAKRGKILSLLYLVASILLTVASALFFKEFKYTDIAYRDAAYLQYIPVIVAYVVEAIFFVATVMTALASLRAYVKENTGKSLRAQDTVLRNEVHAELFGKVKRLGVFSVIYAVIRPVSAALLQFTERHVITAEEANDMYAEGAVVYSSRFAWLWILILAVGALVASLAFSLVKEIKLESGLITDDE